MTVDLSLALLRRADDALVLGHRLSEWCGRAPMPEEDLALANLALDQIGLARLLYAATGRDEDGLAYFRDAREFLNCLLVEQENGDFAVTMVRQWLYSAWADPFWRLAAGSADPTLAGIAGKAEKESAYHLRHAGAWLVRLGDGTAESRARTEAALALLWPFTGELIEADAAEAELVAAGILPDPLALRPIWDATIDGALARAGLARPAGGWTPSGGRRGLHGEGFGKMLAEMQSLARAHPGAVW